MVDSFGFFGDLLGRFVDFLNRPIPLGNDVEVSIFGVSIAVSLGTLVFILAGKLFKD